MFISDNYDQDIQSPGKAMKKQWDQTIKSLQQI